MRHAKARSCGMMSHVEVPDRLSFASCFGGLSGHPPTTMSGQFLCKRQTRCQPSVAGSDDMCLLSQAPVLYILYWCRIVFLSLAPVNCERNPREGRAWSSCGSHGRIAVCLPPLRYQCTVSVGRMVFCICLSDFEIVVKCVCCMLALCLLVWWTCQTVMQMSRLDLFSGIKQEVRCI